MSTGWTYVLDISCPWHLFKDVFLNLCYVRANIFRYSFDVCCPWCMCLCQTLISPPTAMHLAILPHVHSYLLMPPLTYSYAFQYFLIFLPTTPSCLFSTDQFLIQCVFLLAHTHFFSITHLYPLQYPTAGLSSGPSPTTSLPPPIINSRPLLVLSFC